MKIITIPHPTLRAVAKPVTVVDKKLKKFVAELEKTLAGTRNPRGVGLAATQVNNLNRIFSTYLNKKLQSYINPVIVATSEALVLGPKNKEPYLEGCLSIPGIYGPVPRHEWIDLQYQTIQGDELITHTDRFTDYDARVMQHELDHLNGKLFVDYILANELPLYKENTETKKLEEIDSSLFEYV